MTRDAVIAELAQLNVRIAHLQHLMAVMNDKYDRLQTRRFNLQDALTRKDYDVCTEMPDL